MKVWTTEQARSLRKKRAALQLTQTEACQVIGIGEKSLRKLEAGKATVKKSLYLRVLEWLAQDD